MTRSVLAIRGISSEDLGSFEGLLQNADLLIRYVEATQEQLVDLDSTVPDLLVIFGGPQEAQRAQSPPVLDAEIAVLRRRIAANRPTLGIGRGSGLIARALCARVLSGHGAEIGWAPLTLTDAGASSAIAPLNGEDTPVFHWHRDTFDLPQGATLLASSALYPNQAFSWGASVLALQFHPEVTARGLEAWFAGSAAELIDEGITQERLSAESRQFAPLLQAYAEPALHAWLASVGL